MRCPELLLWGMYVSLRNQIIRHTDISHSCKNVSNVFYYELKTLKNGFISDIKKHFTYKHRYINYFVHVFILNQKKGTRFLKIIVRLLQLIVIL